MCLYVTYSIKKYKRKVDHLHITRFLILKKKKTCPAQNNTKIAMITIIQTAFYLTHGVYEYLKKIRFLYNN